MYTTIKRVYKKSYNSKTGKYNTLILDKAIEKGWITDEQKNKIIEEVG